MDERLTIKNLSKQFGSKQALKDVSFSVEPGEIVGLVGPNGAGKTTIMKAVLGLLYFNSGSIQVVGAGVTPMNHPSLGQVGALIEYPGIYPYLSGYDHLRLFAEGKDPEQIDKLVNELKMTNYIHKKAKAYSLGMKQKLGIALALLNEPRLVILDEPLNGLDPQATHDVRELIRKLAKQGTAFLISSHILGELEKIAASLVVIDNGKIVKRVSMAELLIILATSNDEQAKVILREAGYDLAQHQEVRIVKKDDEQLGQIVQLLAQHNIDVLDVKHQQNDLETTLLQLLDTQEKGAEAK